jgi:hypothetical protein
MAYASARFDSKPVMLYVVAAAREIPRDEVLTRGHIFSQQEWPSSKRRLVLQLLPETVRDLNSF